ncbi:MAG: hypothetical protein KGZ65_06175 [Sphingomonadales bacterium]|nr:hypothetical protein [Sphingomonadaceae bacterium]MBS3930806.1 hypothetical protein [Sphingomonadales bacterium]
MERLAEVESQLEENERELSGAATAYFGLKRERDVARAQALLEADGKNSDARNAQALLQIENTDLYREFVQAEAAYEGLALAQKSLIARATIGQSLLRAQTSYESRGMGA